MYWNLLFRRLCHWRSRSVRNSIFGWLFKGWIVSWFPVNIRRTGLSRTTVISSFGCLLLYVLSIKAYTSFPNQQQKIKKRWEQAQMKRVRKKDFSWFSNIHGFVPIVSNDDADAGQARPGNYNITCSRNHSSCIHFVFLW